jgi:hypothetical protein
MDKDIGSTLAGGGAGVVMLSTVRWELIPCGELVKVCVAFALIGLSYVMYRSRPKPPDDNPKV